MLSLTLLSSSFVANSNGDLMEEAYNEGILGRWKYKVQNVDPQYQEGILYIVKESGKYGVNVMVGGGGTVPADEVEVNGNEVKFVVYVEGEKVRIALKIDGNSFTGSGASSQGPFSMTGTRMPEPQ